MFRSGHSSGTWVGQAACRIQLSRSYGSACCTRCGRWTSVRDTSTSQSAARFSQAGSSAAVSYVAVATA